MDKRPEWIWVKPRLATEQEVLRVHRPTHLERLRHPFDFDDDTPYYPGIEEHARRAAGAAIGAVDLALRGRKGFSLMRPPAITRLRPERWAFRFELDRDCCLLRARNRLRTCRDLGLRCASWQRHRTDRFGINRIRFTSIHQYPGYPGSGTTSQAMYSTGQSSRKAMRNSMRRRARALDSLVEFNPDLLRASAGFDAFSGYLLHRNDPGTGTFCKIRPVVEGNRAACGCYFGRGV